jgi:hypothetical protein
MTRMVQSSEHFRFTSKVFFRFSTFALGGENGSHLFDNAKAPKELHVFGQVDGPHTALAQLANDLVAPALERSSIGEPPG